MAYKKGKSSKEFEFRAVALSVGGMTSRKLRDLQTLREGYLLTVRAMGKAVHSAEPLLTQYSAKDLDRILLQQQKLSPLNTVYAERCRLAVKAATVQHNQSYFRRLLGRLRHVVDEIPQADRKPDAEGRIRTYWHVPVEIQDQVSLDELKQLAAWADKPFADVAKRFRQVVLEGKARKLTQNQQIILRDLHARVQQQHREPEFGREGMTVSIPLQYQAFGANDKDLAQRIDQGISTLLEDPFNAKYRFFAAIAHPVPRGERIAIPLMVDAKRFQHLLPQADNDSTTGKNNLGWEAKVTQDVQNSAKANASGPDGKNGAHEDWNHPILGEKDFEANSLTLELGPNGQVGMRLVLTKPKVTPKPLESARYVLGRDFGYKNTITIAIVKLDQAIEREKLNEIQAFTKEQARTYFSTHVIANEPEVVFRLRMSGQAFLNRINVLANQIDGLTSRIDTLYNTLFEHKQNLIQAMGLAEDARIEKDLAPKGSEHRPAVGQFFNLLGQIDSLKGARRARYRTMSAIKKHWFGYLTNLEVNLAIAWEAVHARENLTNVTEEKESPNYKGRAFNRMINAGARGQYNRRLCAKMDWNGVPGFSLPSFYTSTTCYRHSVVHSRQRQGDVFACKACLAEGRGKAHADDHAAETIALYLTLVQRHSHVTPALVPPGNGGRSPGL